MSTSSWYRRSLWNYKGNREYTRSGYEAAATRFNEKDLDVECSDRHYLITGSNSGIGLQIAVEVAKKGGIIHMVCRNQEAATKARSEIITTTGNDKIHLHIVDLAKPRDVVSWAQRFAAQHERLHVLVHNAGCMVHERRVDEDGVEANFAVNTLAVHVITLTLLPLLERSDDSRVIMVSSAGMLCVRLEPHDLMHTNMEPFDGRLVYSQNKRQQVVMALWYAQRYNKVHFASMHPGWADTPAVRTSLPQFYEMMKSNLRTPEQGADTAVWLAISKAALTHPSGLFFQDREPVSTHLPLAWTKSSIEEEDFLMTNIQDVYTNIHSKMFPQTTNAQGTTEASPSTSQSAAPTPESEAAAAAAAAAQMSTGKGANSKAKEEETGVEETSLTEDPPKTEPKTAEIPVLPPPPAPATKVTSSKSEVQEIAEIHAPPASSRKNEDAAAETKEEAKVSQPQEEQKTDAVEEQRTEVPKEAPKTENAEETREEKPEETRTEKPEETRTEKPEETRTEKPEETRTEKPEEMNIEKPKETKIEDPEETKKDTPEETKTENVEETKPEKPEEVKTNIPEEKTDTPEAKREEPSPSSPENAEERTEAPQEDERKDDGTSPPPTSLPEP